MKRAIVMFNLGGPDELDAVRPFLFNLFNDPAIIDVPNPFRWCLAQFISRRRAPLAREIYQQIGGGSPLLANTQAQARALELAIGEMAVGELAAGDVDSKCFIAMRYWHPFVADTVAEVKRWAPDEVVLLPLYPQYSTTTTGSSLGEWDRQCREQGLNVPSQRICCYPQNSGLSQAYAGLIRESLSRAGGPENARLLLSAHGLPKKVVEAGDPYQWHVEQTAAAVVEALGVSNLNWSICYQSRVGPLEWIGPSTEDEILRAGRDGKAVVIAPIAFVSEHSETLVELDIEYRALAAKHGIAVFERVPAVGTDPLFIQGLARMIAALQGDGVSQNDIAPPVCGDDAGRICPADRSRCPCLVNAPGVNVRGAKAEGVANV